MKVAKLVTVTFKTRIVVEHDEQEENYMELVRRQLHTKVDCELSENIDSIDYDGEEIEPVDIRNIRIWNDLKLFDLLRLDHLQTSNELDEHILQLIEDVPNDCEWELKSDDDGLGFIFDVFKKDEQGDYECIDTYQLWREDYF